jgi:hypothetical protein
MTQLGGDIDGDLAGKRDLVETVLARHRFDVVGANSRTTGRDWTQLSMLVDAGLVDSIRGGHVELEPAA